MALCVWLQVAEYVSHTEISAVAIADNGLQVVIGAVDGTVVMLIIADPQHIAPANGLLTTLPNRQLES